MNNDINLIIEKIKKRRKELGFSYQVLANKTKMSKSTLQRYEMGIEYKSPLSLHNTAKEDNSEYNTFTPEEKELIYTYRTLSEEAKNIIDYVIKHEKIN